MLTRHTDGGVAADILEELRSSVRREATPAAFRAPPRAPVAQPPETPPDTVHPFDRWARRQPVQAPVVTAAPQQQSVWSLVPWFLGAGAVIATLLFVSQYGVQVKGKVIQQGDAAISHLMQARSDLESFDFEGAQTSLRKSAEEFDAAARELDRFGPTVTGLIARIPGLSSLRTGQDLLEAGRLLSDAGLALSEAVAATTRSGGLLDTTATERTSLGSVFLPLQNSLSVARENVARASELIGNLDADSLPAEYREQFLSLQGRLPTIRGLVDRAVSATAFISRMTGTDRPRRYLVLFTNPSELRPSGGFPGSYGIITFENGRMKDFRADDVYNPDGQIKELIVPPLQLQHITPGWGMRDAAWWADFPASARKVMEFWERSGNAAVDGVFTMNPTILEGVLRITGPISLPQYDLVLTPENVIATLQLEVESKKTDQPKQVIVDLAPLILERLSSAPAAQWVALMELFKGGFDRRDALMYFADEDLQSAVREWGYDGRVRETAGDYLMIDISNIKGAKADAVTDSVAKLESWTEDGTMMHRLTLTRRHNGGSTDYGFYNKPNYSWVRVLVPEGSVLRGVTGNITPAYKPLMQYANVSAKRDADLEALEATYAQGPGGAVTFRESGKTGFGFWMSVEPSSTDTVQIEYAVPARYVSGDYTLLVQRQPGLRYSDFELTIQKGAGTVVGNSVPRMTEWPDSWRLHDDLGRDLEFSATLR